MVKIREISYSQLFSFGRFQNESIGYTAVLEQGESPTQVLRALMREAVLQHHLNQQAREQEEHVEFIDMMGEETNEALGVLRNKILTLRNQARDIEYDIYRVEQKEKELSRIEAELKRGLARKEEILEELSE